MQICLRTLEAKAFFSLMVKSSTACVSLQPLYLDKVEERICRSPADVGPADVLWPKHSTDEIEIVNSQVSPYHQKTNTDKINQNNSVTHTTASVLLRSSSSDSIEAWYKYSILIMNMAVLRGAFRVQTHQMNLSLLQKSKNA